MGKKQHVAADPVVEPKKRRRVGFSKIDAGIQANDCIKIYLVSSKEEVGSLDSFTIEPIDLNGFFDEDGKIYGYEELKITIWVSSVSFHSYADITFKSTCDGGKGITDLKPALQQIFAETLVDSKDDFLESFSAESNFISSKVSTGQIMLQKASNAHIGDPPKELENATLDIEVIRMAISDIATVHLYSHLIPLVLLLVDGSNPIDVTDPGWELYILTKKVDQNGDLHHRLLGFAALYRFYHYPQSSRLRLSQILVVPPYQGKGFGTRLLEVVNNVAISENAYDFTIEEPLDRFQHVRTCIDIKRLLAFDLVQNATRAEVSQLKQKIAQQPSRLIPPLDVSENVRETLKINKKQFLQCWEILIYIALDPLEEYIEDYITIISNRIKGEFLGKDSETWRKRVVDVPSDYDPEASFVMFRARDTEEGISVQVDETQTNSTEQLQKLVDERIDQIKSIAQKVSK